MHTFALNSPTVRISLRLPFNKLNENFRLSHCDVHSKINSFVGGFSDIGMPFQRTLQPFKTLCPQLNAGLAEINFCENKYDSFQTPGIKRLTCCSYSGEKNYLSLHKACCPF